jgi:hypothetical protein
MLDLNRRGSNHSRMKVQWQGNVVLDVWRATKGFASQIEQIK